MAIKLQVLEKPILLSPEQFSQAISVSLVLKHLPAPGFEIECLVGFLTMRGGA